MLVLFLDGVGLGEADADRNPFARADLPNLRALLGGHVLTNGTPRFSDHHVSFVPTDACLGVHGCPQSATGQATIVTGLNVPRLTGKHWGPKPDVDIQRIVRSDNLLLPLANSGHSLKLANAYPPKFFDAINSGMRSYSALQLAFVTAGIALYTGDDLRDGRAYSADFTTGVFHTVPKVSVAPSYSLRECGRMLARKAQRHSLVLFDHWLSDLIGHRGTMDEAARLLERFDEVMGGIMDEWDMDDGLALVTSDHGNIEDMSSRHHTLNLVPTLLIGNSHARLSDGINDLTNLAPVITEYLS